MGRYETDTYSGRYEYEFDGNGNVILMTSYEDDDIDEIIRLSYELATGIDSLLDRETGNAESCYYDLNGIQIRQPHKGICLVRDGNGHVRKLSIR